MNAGEEEAHAVLLKVKRSYTHSSQRQEMTMLESFESFSPFLVIPFFNVTSISLILPIANLQI